MDSQEQITYIGKVDHRNKLTRFGIKPRDRTKHMYVIGKTGTGKSTFLENMIVQDIQNGHGVAFIDPHGGSAEKLLDYIPEWRVNDVIYINPSDMEYPIAFNPLEDPGPEKRHLVTDGLMSVFKKIWPEAFSGRMEYILNMTMMALMEYPDSTVLSINRMLTDKDFRKKVVAAVTDSAVRNAWDELMKWDDKRWSEAIGALVNKVGQFSTNPVIRNIIGQPHSTFDFRKAMDERKIIIVNLSKGQIGEQNAPLLGAMLITKIYLSAMSRAELAQHVLAQMPPFYFYVDEFQNFANESFASILSEARKYKLCLTVANQFIAQMEESIRDAVFGNMGTTVAFRVGPLDAEFMEKVFAPVFTQEDLQNIAFGQYYLTLQIDNMGSKPFSAQGLLPIPPLQTSMRQQVIDASRRNFAAQREAVEESVKEFFGYNRPTLAKTIHTEPVAEKPLSVTQPVPRTYAPSIPPRPRPPVQQAAPVRPQTQEQAAAAAPSRVAKPLPPVTGFRKPQQQAVAQKPVQPAPVQKPKPAPVGNSESLEALLGKFDEVAIVKPKDPVVVRKPVPVPVPVPVSKPKQSPVLARAASLEKKSALQEALAKAMSAKPSTSPEPVGNPVRVPTPAAVPVPPNPDPAPAVPVADPVPVPEPRQADYRSESRKMREVPEDILRSVLD